MAVRLRRIPRRAAAAVERRFFPGTTDPAEHYQRKVMREAVDAHVAAIGPQTLRAAEISGANHESKPWREFTSLNYPDFDLLAPVETPGGFDVVICEQVLEHVADPWRAAANLRALCAPGGHVIVSSPFLVRIHELPEYGMRDYSRFTPRGLRVLLENAGLEVTAVDAWGNRECVVGNLRRWSAYRSWHSLDNDPDLAIQVWAFARNPDPVLSTGAAENRREND